MPAHDEDGTCWTSAVIQHTGMAGCVGPIDRPDLTLPCLCQLFRKRVALCLARRCKSSCSESKRDKQHMTRSTSSARGPGNQH